MLTCFRWPDPGLLVCPACEQPTDTFVFFFSLTVEDDTGRLPLIFCFQDAARFLGALQPANLAVAHDTFEGLRDLVDGLRAGPNLFAMVSYEVDGRRKYRVVDTTVIR